MSQISESSPVDADVCEQFVFAIHAFNISPAVAPSPEFLCDVCKQACIVKTLLKGLTASNASMSGDSAGQYFTRSILSDQGVGSECGRLCFGISSLRYNRYFQVHQFLPFNSNYGALETWDLRKTSDRVVDMCLLELSDCQSESINSAQINKAATSKPE